MQTTTEADLAPRAAAAPLPLVHLDAEATPVAADVAFADFYQRTRVPVARALALTLGDVELAGEAVDEAMARAYQRWGQVSHYDNPGGWVYRVGLNWGRSVLRVRRRSLHRLYQPDAVEAASIADPDVARALGELSVNHRAVIVCRHLLGWSEQATADALHIRPGTVKSRLSRATAQLQVRLGHLRPEEQQP